MSPTVMSGDEQQAEAFRICLQAIERGRATIDQCVARYPDMPDLRQMLEVSLLPKQLPSVTFPAAGKRALEQRLVARMSARRPSRLRAGGQGRSPWLRLPVVAVSMFIIALGSGLVLVQASSSSLPGDTLYGIKRTVEQVEVSFASDQSRPALMSSIALTRLNELSMLVQRGDPVTSAFWNDVTSSLTIATSLQSDSVARNTLYQRAGQSQNLLAQAGNHPDLAGRMDAILNALATPTPTAIPTDLPTATGTSSPTASIAPTSTSTATSSMTPVTPRATPLSPVHVPTLTPMSSPTPNTEQLQAAVNSCVTDKGMLQSLTVKINAGQLGAFINEVRAQSGKKISTACANQLISLAQSLGG